MRGGCVTPIIGLSSSGSSRGIAVTIFMRSGCVTEIISSCCRCSCGVAILVFVDDFLISPDVGTLILGGSNVELRLCCDGKGDKDD